MSKSALRFPTPILHLLPYACEVRETKYVMKCITQSLVACFAMGISAGCRTATNTYERAAPQAVSSAVSISKVIGDESLVRTIQMTGVVQSTVSGNLRKMQATVENLDSKVRTLNYKIEWIDDSGMAIDSANEGWKTIQLQGRESQSIQSVAVSPKAVDFRLKLRG
jgi:uncharacterized protein YcfL